MSNAVYGTAEPDSLSGTDGADSIFGLAGADVLQGGAGRDTLYGGDGDDTLVGGAGPNGLYGGAGDDVFVFREPADLSGFIGDFAEGDALDFSAFANLSIVYGDQLPEGMTYGDAQPVLLIRQDWSTWLTIHNSSGAWGSLQIDSSPFLVEEVPGSGLLRMVAGQALEGTAAADTLVGDRGNDTLRGSDGDDRLQGLEGNDILEGGRGADVLQGGAGVDTLYGGDGDDTLEGGAGPNSLYGGAGNDVFVYRNAGDLDGSIHDFSAGDLLDFSAFTNLRIVYGAQVPEGVEYSDTEPLLLIHRSDWWTDLALYDSSGYRGMLSMAGAPSLMETEAGSRLLKMAPFVNDSVDLDSTRFIQPNEKIVDSIDFQGDIDYFSFDINNSTGYRIDILGSATQDGTLDDPVLIGLFDSEKNFIPNTGDDDAGFGSNSRFEFSTLDRQDEWPTGEYYFAVKSYHSDAVGSYQVSVAVGESLALQGDGSSESMFGADFGDTLSGQGGSDTLFGFEGSDILYGDDGDDSIVGAGGDDTIYGGRGDDRLNGGEGADRAFFVGLRNEYVIRSDAEGFLHVEDQVSERDGHDVLRGVEILIFADAEIHASDEQEYVDNAATGTLSVTGSAAEGGFLVASLADVIDADGDITSTAYKWQLNTGTAEAPVWINIAGNGANSATLTIPGDQTYVGKQVRVVATTTDAFGGTTEFAGESVTITEARVAGTVQGHVYHWKSHALLSGTTVMLADGSTSGATPSATTAAEGRYSLDVASAEAVSLEAFRPVGDGTTNSGITSADALAALRIAVGLNPNPLVNGERAPISPYQFIAADVNNSGTVTSADALAILRMAVKLSSALPQQWVFVEETRDLWDEEAGSSTLTRTSANWDRSIPADPADAADVNLVGILKGDVNGSWAAPDAALDLDVVDPAYFQDLAALIGVPENYWG